MCVYVCGRVCVGACTYKCVSVDVWCVEYVFVCMCECSICVCMCVCGPKCESVRTRVGRMCENECEYVWEW